jgi:hypothetical protein
MQVEKTDRKAFIKSMGQLFLECYSLLASQEILRLLRNRKVHYPVHKSPLLDRSLHQMNPVHIHTL